jgi:ethanolamine utilization microcompartment shell protein EutS
MKCSAFIKIDTSTRSKEITMAAIRSRLGLFSAALAILAVTSVNAADQKKYDIGATDTEIKIGNIMAYSGPASAYGVIGKTEQAHFQQDQRRGRHQRPQDQLHLLGRRLLTAQDGRAGA